MKKRQLPFLEMGTGGCFLWNEFKMLLSMDIFNLNYPIQIHTKMIL